MLLTTTQTTSATVAPTFDFLTGPRFNTTAALPAEARRAMALLTASDQPHIDPRGLARQTYHVQAGLKWGTALDTAVYTRDINTWSVGFIGNVPLPIGAKVTLRLVAPDGRWTTTRARVRRSRPFGNGAWYESFAEFCLPQYSFENL
jgi:hypothetical protein